MLSVDPERRLGLPQILQHKWMITQVRNHFSINAQARKLVL
jgi:hypothetical protein